MGWIGATVPAPLGPATGRPRITIAELDEGMAKSKGEAEARSLSGRVLSVAARLLKGPAKSDQNRSANRAKSREARANRRNRTGGMREAWRRSRTGVAVIIALTAFINILKLTIPLYIFQLLDRVIASRSTDTLIMLTVIAVFALIMGALAEFVRRWMLVHWGTWIEQHFGKQLFVASLSRRRARGPGRALEDLSEVSQFVSGSGVSTWLDACWAPAFLLLVYLMHPALGVIVLMGMIGMIVIGIMGEVITRPMRNAARKARLSSENWLTTAEHHVETVAGLNIGDRVADRWYKSLYGRATDSITLRLTGNALGEGMRFVEAVQRMACYGIGVWLAISDELSVGAIIAAAVLGRLGTASVRKAMGNWRQTVLAAKSYDRVKRRLAVVRDMQSAIRDLDAQMALQVDQVTHAHNPALRPQLENLNLTIEPGQILCIMGPSGSGKTTLARLVAGMASPTKGVVRLGGLDVTRYSLGERQHLLGYLQQDTTLLFGTIAENISSLREADERAIVEAAKLAGVHEVIERLPEGYETVINPQASALAGGEIRRLGLARALFGRPRLLVLDEPEANLDEHLVAGLMETLKAIRAWGTVTVVTSQAERLAGIADQVVVLSRTAPGRTFTARSEFEQWYAKSNTDEPATLMARLGLTGELREAS